MATDIELVRNMVADKADGSTNPVVDRDNPGPYFSDDIINAHLSFHDDGSGVEGQYSRVLMASSDLAQAWASFYAHRASQESIGGTWTEDMRQISRNWQRIAEDYAKRAVTRPELAISQPNYADSVFSEGFIQLQAAVRDGVAGYYPHLW